MFTGIESECLLHAQVYVIDAVLIPVKDLADVPQTIPAGKRPKGCAV